MNNAHATFPCGHRRYAPNYVGEPGRYSCRTCKQLRDRARQSEIRKTKFKCGHARTPENSSLNGAGRVRCRTCFLDYQHRYKAYRPTPPRFELVSVQPLGEAQSGRSYSLAPQRTARSA